MKIWILQNLRPGFGRMTSVVVRAANEGDARTVASKIAYQEGPSAWTDPGLSSCGEVSVDGSPMAILASYAD